jgi:Putative heavy-metal-binding
VFVAVALQRGPQQAPAVNEASLFKAIGEMVAEAEQMGADAIIGVDYESIQVGQGGSMLMVSASGTAVRLAVDGSFVGYKGIEDGFQGTLVVG